MKLTAYHSDDIAELIDHTRWAESMSWPRIQELSHYFSAYRATKGEWLIREGDTSDFMGLIVEGQVEVIKESNGGQKKLALMLPSQTFGELSLIDGETCSASAQAKEDALILVTNKERLFQLAKENPQLAFDVLWKITQLLSRRLRKTSGELIDYL